MRESRHNLASEILELRNEYFRLSNLPPVAGFRDLFQRVRDSGWKLAVASSSPHGLIARVLEQLGIRECFLLVVSGKDVEHGKPAPDIYLIVAERLDQVDIKTIDCALHGKMNA